MIIVCRVRRRYFWRWQEGSLVDCDESEVARFQPVEGSGFGYLEHNAEHFVLNVQIKTRINQQHY